MHNCYAPRRRRNDDFLLSRGTGRSPTDLRPVYAEVSIVADAAGSAYVELEHTKVASCIRVRQLNKPWQDFRDEGQVVCDIKYALSAVGGGRGDAELEGERELGEWLMTAVEASIQLSKLPKMVVEVYVTILQDDGGVTVALANCVSLALADAGVEMFALTPACAVALTGDEMVVDPDKSAERSADALLSLAIMSTSKEATQLTFRGNAAPEKFEGMLQLAMQGCRAMHSLLRQTLVGCSKEAQEGGVESA